MATIYSFEVFEDILNKVVLENLVDEIREKLAVAFIEQHGDEILKRINDQVIDSKVIAKVVANLREELKKGGPGR